MSATRNRMSVSAIYSEIIDELEKELRDDFLENGVTVEVLSEFKEVWQKKLTETTVDLVDEDNISDATRSSSSRRAPQSGTPLETTHNFDNRKTALLPLVNLNSGYGTKPVVLTNLPKPLTADQIRKLNSMVNSGHDINNILKNVKVIPVPLQLSQFQGKLRPLSGEQLQMLCKNTLTHHKIILPPGAKIIPQVDGDVISDFSETDDDDTEEGTEEMKQMPEEIRPDISDLSETDDDDFIEVTDEIKEITVKITNKDISTDDSDSDLDNDDYADICSAAFDKIFGQEYNIDDLDENSNLMSDDDEIENDESDDDQDGISVNNFSDELSRNTFENIIFCICQNIHRRQHRWIMKFKNGIMHIGGKDYVFAKLNCSAKF